MLNSFLLADEVRDCSNLEDYQFLDLLMLTSKYENFLILLQ